MTAIIIHYSVGVVAAALTVLEFILSVTTGAATLAIFRGLWLSELHRTQRASVSSTARARRIKRRDIFSAILSTWLVVVVASLESNLSSVVWVSNEIIQSDHCLAMNRPLPIAFIDQLRPTLHAGVDSWVLSVVNQIDCQAIGSVETGSASDNETAITSLNAPICTQPVEHGPDKEINIQIQLKEFKVDRNRLSVKPGKTSYVEMLPVDSASIPPTRRGLPGVLFEEQKGMCTEIGISSFPFALTHSIDWIGIFSNEPHTVHAIHELICKSHMITYRNETGENINVVDEDIGLEQSLSCSPGHSTENRTRLELFNPSCLESLSQSKTYSAIISEVWALVLGEDPETPSYACVNVTVEVRYLFVSRTFITAFTTEATVEYPVLVPFSISILSGHCEITANVVARSALVFAADANYRKTPLSDVGLLRLYHLYMMATATVQIPLTSILQGNSTVPCSLRKVYEGTEVKWDWRLGFLIATAIVAGLICLVAVALRYRYNRVPWDLGSAHWAFEQLEKTISEGNENVDLEIVVNKGTETSGNVQGSGKRHLRERVGALRYEIQATDKERTITSASPFD